MSGINLVINLGLALIIFSIFIFSLFSIFTLIKTLINFRKLDELQINAAFEALAISFFILMGIHLLQLMLSSLAPEPLSSAIKFVVSPGFYEGSLISNTPSLHFDSFFIDSFILGAVYHIRRKKYGLI